MATGSTWIAQCNPVQPQSNRSCISLNSFKQKEKKADVNAKDNDGETPWQKAQDSIYDASDRKAELNYIELIHILKAHGGNFEKKGY